MELYDKEHIGELREEAIKRGWGYLPNSALISFDKALRAQVKKNADGTYSVQ